MPDGGAPTTQVIVAPGNDGHGVVSNLQFFCQNRTIDKDMDSACVGQISCKEDPGLVPFVAEEESVEEIQLRCSEKVSGPDYYRQLGENGIQYGSFFQSITQLWLDNKSVLAELRISSDPDSDFSTYQLHPAVLDGCLQVLGAAVATEAKRNGKQGIYIADPHRRDSRP